MSDTDPSPELVDAVEAFLARHGADPGRVRATGLREIVGTDDTDAIAAALDEIERRTVPAGPHEGLKR